MAGRGVWLPLDSSGRKAWPRHSKGQQDISTTSAELWVLRLTSAAEGAQRLRQAAPQRPALLPVHTRRRSRVLTGPRLSSPTPRWVPDLSPDRPQATKTQRLRTPRHGDGAWHGHALVVPPDPTQTVSCVWESLLCGWRLQQPLEMPSKIQATHEAFSTFFISRHIHELLKVHSTTQNVGFANLTKIKNRCSPGWCSSVG